MLVGFLQDRQATQNAFSRRGDKGRTTSSRLEKFEAKRKGKNIKGRLI
jgi:hypothetical protein